MDEGEKKIVLEALAVVHDDRLASRSIAIAVESKRGGGHQDFYVQTNCPYAGGRICMIQISRSFVELLNTDRGFFL